MKIQAIILMVMFLFGCEVNLDATYEGQDPFATRYTSGVRAAAIRSTFTQETTVPVKKPSVDILFVINNNTSMRSTLGRFNTNLPVSFKEFIDKLLLLNINFKLGILLSDDPANKDTNGKLNSVEAKRDKNAFKADFVNKIKYTASSNKVSEEFFQTKQFFENNPNWTSRDSYLIVIFATTPGGAKNKDIDIVRYLQGLKRDKELVKICAIAGNAPNVRKAARKTGGWGYDKTILLNPDFLEYVSEYLGEKLDGFIGAMEKRLIFQQNVSIGVEEIKEIQVDNIAIFNTDWTFEDGENFITIADKAHKALKPANTVKMILNKPLSQFRLNENLDISFLDNIEIKINDQPISKSHWEYNQQENSIEFLSDHIPAVGSTISITYIPMVEAQE